MTQSSASRRNALKLLGASAGASLLPKAAGAEPTPKPAPKPDFIYSLNMSTIKGHKLGFVKELEVASKAGFRSVEIWMDSLQAYLDGGGKLTGMLQHPAARHVQVVQLRTGHIEVLGDSERPCIPCFGLAVRI